MALKLVLLAVPDPVGADELLVRQGAELFDRPWRAAEGGDAPGPLLAARACAACHPGGDSGDPRGPALVFRTLAVPTPFGRQLQPHAAAPGVAPEPRPALAWEEVQGPPGQPPLRRPGWSVDRAPLAGRLAPPLRGLGLLARVPERDLLAAADPTDRDGDGVSGRLAARANGRAGRFSSKAEHADLGGQIAAALSLDMGLATAAHPAPAGDCTPAQANCLAVAGDGAPVPPGDLAALTAYLEALRPRPSPPRPPGDAGAGLFAAAGCAACHTPTHAVPSDPAVTGRTTERIAPYTDLLLHDLGPGLADPSPAPDAAEWRTAPLWGLRSRRAFLHDGRAASPREAVLWHGGKAAGNRERFLALPAAARAELLGFLSRL